MAPNWGLAILVAVFGSSFLLGGASAYLLVRLTEKTVNWVFAVPFTLWWLVAGLSAAVHVFGIRVTPPEAESAATISIEPQTSTGPLTPRSTLPLDDLEAPGCIGRPVFLR